MSLFKRHYSEAELIEGCVQNKRKHQELLYKRYFDAMFAMCRKHTRDEEEALSVLNNGFLKVFKSISSFSFKGSFEGWVRRIIYHTLVEHLRQHNKYAKFIMLEEPAAEKSSTQQPEALDHLFSEDIMNMMSSVPLMSSKVFELYAIEGYNHREIGEILGMSENTSKWHLANARRILKEQLRERKKKENIAG